MPEPKTEADKYEHKPEEQHCWIEFLTGVCLGAGLGTVAFLVLVS